ncbi:hypothetical protein MASR2M32_00590 [Sphaerotilus sulfidivorans]
MARHLIPSDKTIKALKPGATDDDGAPVKRLNDGDGLFLMLWVKGGAHGWRFQYTLNGRRNILSLGTYLSRPGRFFGRFLNKSGDLARQDLRASRGV